MPFIKSSYQDTALTALRNGVQELWLCPNFDESTATFASVNAVKMVVITLQSGDFTLANGDVDGRKLHYAGNSATALSSGTIAKAVAVNTTNSTIELIANITQTAIQTGGTVTVNPFDFWEVGNPT